ncbi:MAG: D-glycerate dehydrogenase [Anaerolineaceae bacterium]|nr:D-glycerate dehydrogenase [Anaerolineaceae bacterium]
MSKPEVLVTRDLPGRGLELLKSFCEVDLWTESLPPSRELLLEHIKGKDGLLCMLSDKIDAEVMDAAGPQLKVISNYAVGFDNIAIAEATARKISVGNTPGILTNATADFAFALLLAAARRVAEAQQYIKADKWKTWGPSMLLGPDLAGATLGLIGFGRIGQAVAKRASGFDMRVLYYSPTSPPVPEIAATPVGSLESLLSQSDFVSLHIPLTVQTRQLVDAQFLAQMKPSAILVNTSRGQMVDQDALYVALKEKRIFAAALDVTDPEPLPATHPLLTLENCLITPHIASGGKQTREKMSVVTAENLIAGLKGDHLPYCVNPEVYG